MTLAARDGATGRPEEVMSALGIEPETTRVERTRLIFKDEIFSRRAFSGIGFHVAGFSYAGYYSDDIFRGQFLAGLL